VTPTARAERLLAASAARPPDFRAIDEFNGAVILEWWQPGMTARAGSRTLTVYATGLECAWLRAWGHNIVTQMADGTLGPVRLDRLAKHVAWVDGCAS
jgi:hypothetical protein